MIEEIGDLPPGIHGFRAGGTVSTQDYERSVVPVVDAAEAAGRRLRMLCVVDPDFRGLRPSAAWEDVKVGLRTMKIIDGVAVVSDRDWIRRATRAAAFLMTWPVAVFDGDDRDDAVRWLEGLARGDGFSVSPVGDGVVLAEVGRAGARPPGRAVDLLCRARARAARLAHHDEVRGLVLHTSEDTGFPGWANVRALVRHLDVVRRHQARIRRIALAVDSDLAEKAPAVVGRLLHPQVRHFDADDLDDALAWARAT